MQLVGKPKTMKHGRFPKEFVEDFGIGIAHQRSVTHVDFAENEPVFEEKTVGPKNREKLRTLQAGFQIDLLEKGRTYGDLLLKAGQIVAILEQFGAEILQLNIDRPAQKI